MELENEQEAGVLSVIQDIAGSVPEQADLIPEILLPPISNLIPSSTETIIEENKLMQERKADDELSNLRTSTPPLIIITSSTEETAAQIKEVEQSLFSELSKFEAEFSKSAMSSQSSNISDDIVILSDDTISALPTENRM